MRGMKDKSLVIRHGHGPRRGCNAAEKAIETRQRQAARAEIQAAEWRCPKCGAVMLETGRAAVCSAACGEGEP